MEEKKNKNFSFRVLGEPVAKARPRFNSKTRVAYTKSKTTKAENSIKYEYLKNGGERKGNYTGTVKVRMLFVFPIRKSWTKKKQKEMLNSFHTIKPDLDNLEKTVLDALNGLAFKDDSQVCEVTKIKAWSEIPYTQVTLIYE